MIRSSGLDGVLKVKGANVKSPLINHPFCFLMGGKAPGIPQLFDPHPRLCSQLINPQTSQTSFTRSSPVFKKSPVMMDAEGIFPSAGIAASCCQRPVENTAVTTIEDRTIVSVGHNQNYNVKKHGFDRRPVD